jgi:hypothetical protein
MATAYKQTGGSGRWGGSLGDKLVREFLDYMNGLVFLKRKLMGFGTDRLKLRNTQVNRCPFMCLESI